VSGLLSPVSLMGALRASKRRRSGGSAPTAWYANDPGYTERAHWNNQSTVATGGFVNDGSPFRALTASSGGLTSITTTSNTIVASAGSWITAGVLDTSNPGDIPNCPQYVRLIGQDPGNEGIYALITSSTASTLTVSSTLTANAVADTTFTANVGWGEKNVVSSGYTGTPTIGGTQVVETFYPAAVDGGHDAGRMTHTVTGTPTNLYVAMEFQLPSNYPTSNSSGGNKQLFVTFSGGSRYFVNFDIGAAAGNVDIYEGSTRTYTSTTAMPLGSWATMEWILHRVGAGADSMTLYINGVAAITQTGITFPTGTFATVYDDGTNNGNRPVTGTSPEERILATPGPGGFTRAGYRWTSDLYVAYD